MMPLRLLLRSEMCAEDQLQRNFELKTTCRVLSAERLRAAGGLDDGRRGWACIY